jgi:hypothetical protein
MLPTSWIFRSVSVFPNNPDYPSPHTVRIAYWLLCVPSVDVSKHQRTTFTFIYSLLSTPYNVSTNDNNNNTANIHITLYWGAFVLPLLQWGSSKYYILWVCVFNFSFPASNAHMLYFHLWSVPFHNISPHCLINGTLFEKKSYCTQNLCFDFH